MSDIDRAVREATASLQFEGFVVSEELKQLLYLRMTGKISHEEYLKEALMLEKIDTCLIQ